MRVPVALQESIPIALGALRANKARGALTTLGIIIGIVAVVLTMTAANGLENKFRESFSSVGSDIIYVSRMPWVVMNDFFKYRNRPGNRHQNPFQSGVGRIGDESPAEETAPAARSPGRGPRRNFRRSSLRSAAAPF